LDSTATIPDVVTHPTLLFRVGSDLHGCDIGNAQEIIPLRAVTRIPGAPAYVRGLINMRGTIVTVLDLGVRLDPSRSPVSEGSILLIRHHEHVVGIVVDEVLDMRLLEIDVDEARGSRASVVRGVATFDGAAVIVLDLDALITQVLLS